MTLTISNFFFRLSNRCNTEIDCADKSDEYHCSYLNFGPNYAKELIPRDEEGTAVIIFMNISILAFPDIDNVNLKFTTDFFLNLRWYDLRVDFKDLNNITSLNSLSEKARDTIWTPQLAFVNALGPFQTVADEMTSGVLIREGHPLQEDLSISTEGKNKVTWVVILWSLKLFHFNLSAMLFSGRENSIMITREYYQEYSCDFDLKYYPFDTQVFL